MLKSRIIRMTVLLLLAFALCGCTVGGSLPEEGNSAPLSFSSLKAFEEHERAAGDGGMSCYYVPSALPQDYVLSRVTKREDVYVTLEYILTTEVSVDESLSDYDRERLRTLICQYYLFPDGSTALEESFLSYGYEELRHNEKLYYRWDEHAENDPEKRLLGYEIAFLREEQLIYMHLPAVDTFENMIKLANVVRVDLVDTPIGETEPARPAEVTVGEMTWAYVPQDTAEKTVENIFASLAEDPEVAVCTLQGMEAYEPQNTRFVEEKHQTDGREVFGKEVPATTEYWQENVKLLYAKYLIRFASGGGTTHYRLLMPMARDDATGLWYIWTQPEQEIVEGGDSVIPHAVVERYEEGKIYYGDEAPWLYRPVETPELTVRYILYGENLRQEVLSCWEISIEADDKATQAGIKALAESEEGKKKGYTEESLQGHFQVLQATYKMFFDRDKTRYDVDGVYLTTFSMLQDPNSGLWSVYSSVKPKLLEELEPQPIIPNPHRQSKNPEDADYNILTATKPEYERGTTPEETARNCIESWNNSYGTISAEVISLEYDEELTSLNRGSLVASERGQKYNFTAEYLLENFAVVKVTYSRVRDVNVPQFEADGICKSIYHMIRDPETGLWYIIDSLTPYTVND